MNQQRVWYWVIVGGVAVFLFWSLSPQRRADQAVSRSIEASGGWKVWKKKQAIQFLQTEIFYDSTGQEAGKKISMHRILLGKIPKVHIESVAEPVQKLIWAFDGREAWVTLNGDLNLDWEQIRSARWLTWRSHYLVALPFSLKSGGISLKYQAKDQIRVSFPQNSPNTGERMLLYLDQYHRIDKVLFSQGQLAQWRDYRQVEGIQLATRRFFYPADEKGQISGPKIKEELIEEVEFRAYLSNALFESPRR